MFESIRLTAWDSLQILTKKFSDQQVRMVVELDGRLDEVRLAAAVRAAVDAEPVLACRVRKGLLHPSWKDVSGFNAKTLLRVIPTAEPDKEIHSLLVEDLDPWRGPVVRIGLVRSERDVLVVNLDHTAGDAASVRSLTYLLATLYNHPDRTLAPGRSAYFAKRGFQSLRPLMPEVDGKAGSPKPPGSAEPAWRFPWRPGVVEFRKRLLIRRLAPEKARAIHDFVASRNAWFNDVCLAAYFRALSRLVRKDAGIPRLTVPVDMRAYLSARERPRIANFSAPLEVTLDRELGGSFEETLGLVRAGTEKEKQGRPGLAQAAALCSLVDRIPFRIIESRLGKGKTGMTLPPPWFIALGVLRPESLSFGPVAARYAYSLQSVSRAGGVFQLSASLFGDSITLAVCFAGDDANEEVVDRFLDFCEAELPS
jgi:NRPS condensation-like uncharacterized protein